MTGQATPAPHEPPSKVSDTVAEVRHLQALARSRGVSFSYALLVYGIAAIVGSVALVLGWETWFDLWWLLVAIAAPVLIGRNYRRRLRLRGVGMGWLRAMRHVVAAEALAVALWLQPFVPIRNAPWLALVAVTVVAGFAWQRPVLYVTAAGVLGMVVASNVLASPLPVPDLVIGLWLCASALADDRFAKRLPAAMMPPRSSPH